MGEFEVRPLFGRIAFFDFELDERMSQAWFRKLGVRNTEKVQHFPFRGLSNPFLNPNALEQLAEELRFHEIEFLIIDPFSSIFSGNQNENGEVKSFLKSLDDFKEQA